MADLAAKVLQLSPEQHDMLGHAIALAHAVHSSIGGKGLGVAPGELHDALSHVDIFVQPGHGGKGWWSTLADTVEKGAKELQSSELVRGLEKRAVGAAQKYGTKALQGLADSALAETGAGELLAPMANRAIASGTKRLENWADDQIDASGRGHICGSGMRLAGSIPEPRGAGMRLAGAPSGGQPLSGLPHAGGRMRLAA